MAASSQRPVSQDRALASLNTAINVLNLGKEVPNVTPAKAAFGSVSALLAMIKVHLHFYDKCLGFTSDQDSMVHDADYVDLALQCADICRALDRGMSGKRLDGFSQSISDAIEQLTRRVEPKTLIPNPTPTTIPSAVLLQRYRERPLNKADDQNSLESFIQGTTRIRLQPGSQTLTGSFMSSTCVPPVGLPQPLLTARYPDRARYEYPRGGRWGTPEHLEGTRG